MSDAGEMEGDATTSRVRCAQDASRSMNLAVRMQPHLPSLWLPAAMPWLALDQSICANCVRQPSTRLQARPMHSATALAGPGGRTNNSPQAHSTFI
jgi:hypothetical protein